MKSRGWVAAFLAVSLGCACFAGEREDALFAAARKGDARAVKELLAQGVDVNARYRYNRTALSFAADRGHLEVVKVLLEHGADVTTKDTFYGMTPLSQAASNGHTEIVRMLLAKGARDADGALLSAVSNNNREMVEVILKAGRVAEETLTEALEQAMRRDRTEIADALKQAGAVPLPKTEFAVDAETLQSYAGTYRSGDGSEMLFTVKGGKLAGGPAGQGTLVHTALDKTSFRPGDFLGIRVIFEVQGGKVTGLTLKERGNRKVYARVAP